MYIICSCYVHRWRKFDHRCYIPLLSDSGSAIDGWNTDSALFGTDCVDSIDGPTDEDCCCGLNDDDACVGSVEEDAGFFPKTGQKEDVGNVM